jgi:hypothetical protein
LVVLSVVGWLFRRWVGCSVKKNLKKWERWDPELLKNQPKMGRQSSQIEPKIKKNGAGGTPKEEQNTKMKKRGGPSNSFAVF